METEGISVTQIGRQFGATAMEVNLLLQKQGFLTGEPGAYVLTPKGKEFGYHQAHDNGLGGFGHVAYETTHFDPAVADILDVSPENLAEVRDDLSARRQEQRDRLKADRAEANRLFLESEAQREADAAGYEIDTRKVVALVAGVAASVAAGIGIYQLVPWRKRKRAAKAATDDES